MLDTDDVALITGPSTGQNLTIARSSIQARNNGSAYQLYLNERGGGVNIGATQGNLNVQGTLSLNTITSTESDLPSAIFASVKNTTTGKTYSSSIISAYQDHGSTPYGLNLVIGSGGNTILGSGESPANLYSTFIKNNTAENLYLISDGYIYLEANANTVGNRVGIGIDTTGNMVPQKVESANSGIQSLGLTDNRWKDGFLTGCLRVGAASSTASSTTDKNVYVGPDGIYMDSVAAKDCKFVLRGKGADCAIFQMTTLGVANTTGQAEFILGNATAYTTANNAKGILSLYSSGTKGNYLVAANNSTAWYTITLPAKTGTVALTSDLVDTQVTQGASTTGNWRKILLSAQNTSTKNAAVSAQTNTAYVTTSIEAQSNTGYIGTTGYYIYNTTTAYGNFRVVTAGTAETIGSAQMVIGNATAANTAGNARGEMYIYGNTTKYSGILSTLDIKGNHINYLPKYSTSTSTYYGKLVGIYKGTTSGSDGFSDVGSSSIGVYVTANGVAKATGSSDVRLKNIQGNIPDVSSISAVRFTWNDLYEDKDNKEHIGYVAQDVEKIAPFLVDEDENGYKRLNYIEFFCAKIQTLEKKIEQLEQKKGEAIN